MRPHLYVALLFAWLLPAGTGCQRQAPPVSIEDVRAEAQPDQESWDVRFAILNGDRPRVLVEAGYMAQFKRGDSTYVLLTPAGEDTASFVTAYLFDTTGDSTATLTADRLRYYETERRMEARGRVLVVTREGKRLESEHLEWLEVEAEVRTRGFVRITTPTERIQGYDLVADEDLETYDIARITGQVRVDDA